MTGGFNEWFKGLFNRRSIPIPGKAKAMEETAVTDTVLNDLVMAKAIYSNEPPWLNIDNPPLKPSGIGPLIASRIATIITVEAKISVDGAETTKTQISPEGKRIEVTVTPNPERKAVDDIIQDFIMPNLQEEVEKGWALGGLVFKPYYSDAIFNFDAEDRIVSIDGKLKIGFLYPNQYLIDDFDKSGAILKVRFFATVFQDNKYYTKVETQIFHERERTLEITNIVYETSGTPTAYIWDDLGDIIVSLDRIEKWANIPERMTFTDVHGCLIGVYRPAIANNVEPNSPYGRSPLVRAKEALERIDRAVNALDWELESSLARLFIDERSIAAADGLPKRIAKYVVKLLGDENKKMFEKFAPEIRQEDYLKSINFYMRLAELQTGLATGSVSETEFVARTATEISKSQQPTYTTVVGNQKAIESAIRQMVKAVQVWLNPGVIAEELPMTFYFDDSIVSNPTEQIALFMLLQNNRNIPQWMTNQMYFNKSEEEARQMVLEAELERQLVEELQMASMLHGRENPHIPLPTNANEAAQAEVKGGTGAKDVRIDSEGGTGSNDINVVS